MLSASLTAFWGLDRLKRVSAAASASAVMLCAVWGCAKTGKKPEDQLFDTMSAQDLNTRLKDLMDGLSVKARMRPPPCMLTSNSLYSPAVACMHAGSRHANGLVNVLPCSNKPICLDTRARSVREFPHVRASRRARFLRGA